MKSINALKQSIFTLFLEEPSSISLEQRISMYVSEILSFVTHDGAF